MGKLFGVDIAGIVGREIGSRVLPATLTKVTQGDRDADDPTSGRNPVETVYNCRGFVSDYAESRIDGTLVQKGDRKVILIAATIKGAIPEEGDFVTCDGETLRIVDIPSRDPATATYTCHGRKN